MERLTIITANGLVFLLLLLLIDIPLGNWSKRKPSADKVPAAIYSTKIKGSLDPQKWTRHKTADLSFNYTRDNDGYRGRRDSSKSKILTIGGSTTDERFIDDRFTWSEIFERSLNTKPGNIDVINAGVDGQSSFGHLYSIKEWHSKALPKHLKAVVFYIGFNDTKLVLEGINESDAFNNPSLLRRAHNLLKKNSFVYAKSLDAYNRLRNIYSVKGPEVVYGHAPRDWEFLRNGIKEEGISTNTALEYRTEKYKELIQSLIKETAYAFPEAEIFIVQQYIPGCTFRYSKEIFNRQNEASATRRDCTYHALVFDTQLSAIRELHLDTRNNSLSRRLHTIQMQYITGFDDNGFYDHIHSTRAGSERIGKYIADKVRRIIDGS